MWGARVDHAGAAPRSGDPRTAATDDAVRLLQRSAGNRAVTRYLARYDESSLADVRGRLEELRRLIESGGSFYRDLYAAEAERLRLLVADLERRGHDQAKEAWMGKGKLVYASRHPKVRELQGLLNAAGADPQLAVDQQFFEATLRAVKRFQARRGLKSDGVVGEKTWAALGGTGPLPSVYEQQPAKHQRRRTTDPMYWGMTGLE